MAILFASHSAAVAQAPALRDLGVPIGKAWQHAETELILPSQVMRHQRQALRANGVGEFDVTASYAATDGTIATVYLFRPQTASASLWFDRARTVLETLGSAGQQGQPAATAFAVPGGSAPSALRVAYPASGRGYASTALAVAPLGGWIVKVRMSSPTLDAAALDAALAAFMQGLRWPRASTAAPAARPIEACAGPLTYRRAKQVKPDMASSLLGSLLSMAAASKPAPAVGAYCREPGATVASGVYRADANADGYLIGLADSGRSISVGAMSKLETDKPFDADARIYGVSLHDLDRTVTYPSYNRLPAPNQVFKELPSSRPLSSNPVGTTTINLNLPDD